MLSKSPYGMPIKVRINGCRTWNVVCLPRCACPERKDRLCTLYDEPDFKYWHWRRDGGVIRTKHRGWMTSPATVGGWKPSRRRYWETRIEKSAYKLLVKKNIKFPVGAINGLAVAFCQFNKGCCRIIWSFRLNLFPCSYIAGWWAHVQDMSLVGEKANRRLTSLVITEKQQGANAACQTLPIYPTQQRFVLICQTFDVMSLPLGRNGMEWSVWNVQSRANSISSAMTTATRSRNSKYS